MTGRTNLDNALLWLDDIRESIGEGPDEHNELACQALMEAEDDLFRVASEMEGDNCPVCFTIRTSARAAMALDEVMRLAGFESPDEVEYAYGIVYERKNELLSVIEAFIRHSADDEEEHET